MIPGIQNAVGSAQIDSLGSQMILVHSFSSQNFYRIVPFYSILYVIRDKKIRVFWDVDPCILL